MQLVVATDAPAVASAAVARKLRDAVRRRGVASVALSGGSTAPPMIELLVEADLPWDSVAVWQVDERIRPDGHPARNASQLAGLPCRVHLMPVTAADLRGAARRYAAGLPDRFDVVHLGVGDDGHTASWPPGRPEVVRSTRAVELVPAFNGHDRMTLTGAVVNGARSRVVLTVGASKRPMVERWLAGDRSIPVTALHRRGTTVVVDDAAAPRGGLGSAAGAGV